MLFLYIVGPASLPDAAHIAIDDYSGGWHQFSHMNLRRGNVAVKVAFLFALPGLVGSLIGAYMGRITPDNYLLAYFAIAMMILAGYPQAARLDIYSANRAEEVLDYAMKHTTENNVPEPIDYVDRYVRIDTATIKRTYQILKNAGSSPKALIALSLTNPQKRYLYEEKVG